MKKDNPIALVVGGIVIVLASYVWMGVLGLGGILIAPLFYIVGPAMFFTGINQIFLPRHKKNLKYNLHVVGVIIAASIIGVLFVVLLIEMREDSCYETYGNSFSSEYDDCKSKLF